MRSGASLLERQRFQLQRQMMLVGTYVLGVGTEATGVQIAVHGIAHSEACNLVSNCFNDACNITANDLNRWLRLTKSIPPAHEQGLPGDDADILVVHGCR
jgi:hypothetical protein